MKATSKLKKLQTVAVFMVMFIFNTSFAANERKVSSKIEKAIVFLKGAQLYSSSDFAVSAGTNTLVFDGVSPFIDAQTIQATATGNIIILDVQHLIKYPEVLVINEKTKPKNYKQILVLEDSVVQVGWLLEELADKKSALNTEKNTLLNNRMIKGETKRDSLALLKDALEYLRNRLYNINAELMKIKREEYKITLLKERLEEKLTDLNSENSLHGELNPEQKNGAVNQVVVTVSSLFAMTSSVKINYFINNAGWTPSYDLRASSANSDLRLDQKANVYQSSGLDWKDVNLTLSTGTPNEGNIKPALSPNYLNYYQPRSYSYQGAAAPSINTQALDLRGARAEEKYADKDEILAKTTADYTVVVENPIRIDYEIKLKYEIPSDSKAHIVIIQSKEIPSNFSYSAIPKLDPNAFLQAKVTDWESMNLIPGSARIYFDGTYIGASSINPQETEDTLQLNMGRDKSIVIERKRMKNKSKDKTFNNDRVVTYGYEITVRNTKNESIKLNVEDQIPVAQNEEIKVELIESSQAKMDESTGSLMWNINLKPKEVRKLTFVYEIKYPKTKQLAGL